MRKLADLKSKNSENEEMIKNIIIKILTKLSNKNIDIIYKFFNINLLSNIILNVYVIDENENNKNEVLILLENISNFISNNVEFKNKIKEFEEIEKFKIIIKKIQDNRIQNILNNFI